jgi:hypothetical protein
MRGSRGCSRSTHNNIGGWRMSNYRAPNNVRLISSMLSVISKLYVSLVVDDPLNVWSIDHILGPMLEHIHQLYPEKCGEELDHQVWLGEGSLLSP